jgi:type II secretory pathway component PulM
MGAAGSVATAGERAATRCHTTNSRAVTLLLLVVVLLLLLPFPPHQRRPAESVMQRSNSVNAKLHKRGQHIEELNRVQALLAQLQVGGLAVLPDEGSTQARKRMP